MRHTARLLTCLLVTAFLTGCAARRPQPAALTPVEQADPELAKPGYWLSQPEAAAVEHDDFDELWRACTRAAKDRSFRIDRQDRRNGVITTVPSVSRQFFEFWRHDTATAPDSAESSLATVRRTLRFDIERRDDGTFRAVPKVLVERFTSTERRITSVTQYREVFSIERAIGSGERERERGYELPTEYWYAVGRDEALERRVAAHVEAKLRSMVARR